jgi:hypothetical protein
MKALYISTIQKYESAYCIIVGIFINRFDRFVGIYNLFFVKLFLVYDSQFIRRSA